jgi:hypothetical protein
MQAVLARDFARLSGMGGSNDTVSLAASPARSAESSDAPRAKRKKKAVSYKDLSDRAFFKVGVPVLPCVWECACANAALRHGCAASGAV